MKNFNVLLLMILFTSVLFISCDDNSTDPPVPGPDVTLVFAQANQTVNDTITLSTTFSDISEVSMVMFYVDQELIGKVEEAPFEIKYDTKNLSNGNHTVSCVAFDHDENTTQSEVMNFSVFNYLLKVMVYSDWLELNGSNNSLFISDKDGKVIKSMDINGAGEYEFKTDSLNTPYDTLKTILFTIVHADENLENKQIFTYMDIPVQSLFYLKNHDKKNMTLQNNAQINLNNIPQHEGFLLSSRNSYLQTESGSLENSYNLPIYADNTNLLVKLKTGNSSYKYKWFNNITPGAHNLNLAGVQEAPLSYLQCDREYEAYSASVFAYEEEGNHAGDLYPIDLSDDDNFYHDAIPFFITPNFMTDFNVEVTAFEGGGNYYFQSTYGIFPDRFTELNADFTPAETNYNNYKIIPTGQYDMNKSNWITPDYKSQWIVYSDEETTHYGLPKIPATVSSRFNFNNSDFILYTPEIVDFGDMNGYHDYVNLIFGNGDFVFDVISAYRLRGRVNNYSANKLNFNKVNCSLDKKF